MRQQLRLGAAFVQIPIGLEGLHEGVIDIIGRKAVYFLGDKGLDVTRKEIPEDLVEACEEARTELVERLADIDDEIAELFIAEEAPTEEQLKAAIRRQTIAQKFVPVFMGSAFKNKGVQLLLDGVNDYLPSPSELTNRAVQFCGVVAVVSLKCDTTAPLVALAFKLEESRFGQLTYIRVYQGMIKKGMLVFNAKNGKKVKVPRLVRMHANEMMDVDSAGAGDVVALFGMDCSSMDTFTDGTVNYSMVSMFVPNPVMSLSVKPKESAQLANFGKAMGKFTREDPTLRVVVDEKSGETVMSGMGELHLEIYVERMKREYNVECVTGNPSVSYKETITSRSNFDYLHKKQSGGSGQYAKVIGYIEPLEDELIKKGIDFEFDNQVIGTNIPPEFIPSCEKGARAACAKGVVAGFPLTNVRVVITDGQAHTVDSNDLAFQLAMQYGIRQAAKTARPQVLQPIMNMEVESPSEFQGVVVGTLNKRSGLIMASDLNDDGSQVRLLAHCFDCCTAHTHLYRHSYCDCRCWSRLRSPLWRCSDTARCCAPARRARASSPWSTRTTSR
jgi:elongation factor G